MSDTARHRASRRASTPLAGITDTVTGQLSAVTGSLGVIGRSGAVVAVSTGLAAAGGITVQSASAQAVAAAPAGAASAVAAPATAANPFSSGVLRAAPALGTASAPLTAPMTATVRFETGSFRAVPPPAPPRVERPVVRAQPAAPRVSRSTTRTVRRATPVRTTHATPKKATTKAAPAAGARGSSVLAIAARYVGTPYRYGGTTPAGFDCSGYTGYVYRQLGIHLPRTANAQLGATRRVSRSQARAGDLVFFLSGSRAYHVGIYAGNGYLYDSPKPGKSVQKRKIWDAAAVFGRVTG